MVNKSLLYGIIGFLAGGLLVSSVFALTNNNSNNMTMYEHNQQTSMGLDDKTGDEYDKAFIEEMIMHHEGAIDMAELAEKNAQHEEIKQLSKDIIAAQTKEIEQMKAWYSLWGYGEYKESDHMYYMMQ